ncbi:dsDNA nuclease domain-containing protein [Streptomyces sp. NPDC048419]|uniref:dsDNA nuclease domain-containing protein n=1 Tax=Streptomyces sp. NPDC048419 TaxID=3365547 RepID=UPI003711B26F
MVDTAGMGAGAENVGTPTEPDGPNGSAQAPFELAPEEDSGSDTLGRYRFQAEVAAWDCLAMLTQDTIDFVVCEGHEDFVVAWADGSVELVSVKHREESQGTWPLVKLCKSGGLTHLFDRWCACECADVEACVGGHGPGPLLVRRASRLLPPVLALPSDGPQSLISSPEEVAGQGGSAT